MDDRMVGTVGKALAEVMPGDRVFATDGEVGTVHEVIAGDDGRPASIVVACTDGQSVEVPLPTVTSAAGGEVRLAISRQALHDGMTSPQGYDITRLSVHEEVLEATTAPVQRGTVRVVRRVETAPVSEVVQTWQEVVDVERVPVNREIDVAPEPWMDGDTIVIPVVEEVVVTETRLVLREEVRVKRRRVAEPVTIEAEVRREHVEVIQEALASDESLRDRGGG